MKYQVGVDGCRAGWFATWFDNSGVLQGQIYPSIEALFLCHKGASKILVDIPIGLLKHYEREIESKVRSLLGPRRSSVFPVPCYDAVYAKDYSDANKINRLRVGKGLSKQAWFISPKIREVNDLLLQFTEAKYLLGESHPELCFAQFNQAPMAATKKSQEGQQDRLIILKGNLPSVEEFVDCQMRTHKRKDLNLDDCLDALILLTSAGQATALTQDVYQEGEGGIPIRMWVPGLES